ncbi:DNA-directed RNA polymerase subunit omega [Planctomycetota bacterium]|nr:DNA-directed RNA polymerase subunit omega [Planctomycetota bacterium]
MASALDYPELEELYAKAGGKFRFTVLIQRRVGELVRGDRRLVSLPHQFEKDFMRIAIEEFKADKITLSETGEALIYPEEA